MNYHLCSRRERRAPKTHVEIQTMARSITLIFPLFFCSYLFIYLAVSFADSKLQRLWEQQGIQFNKKILNITYAKWGYNIDELI